MIVADRVSKDYGRFRALDEASFEVPSGQIVGLLGPNGAGKTTSIRIITGYLPPTSGRVTIGGHDTVTDSRGARGLLGYLPESAPLYPEMLVRDYLDHRARLYGMARAARREAVGRVTERCWLTEVARRRIGHLSKGFRQRVGLAAALVHDPAALVLDEPTNGLDPTQIRETRSLIRELAQDRTVLICSHILPEIERTCDRVIIIARGRIRADGTPDELVRRNRAQSPYIVELRVEAEKAGNETVARLRALKGVNAVSKEEPEPGVLRLRIDPDAGAPDLREAIARAASESGVLARELHHAAPSLEEIFMRVIGDADSVTGAPDRAKRRGA